MTDRQRLTTTKVDHITTATPTPTIRQDARLAVHYRVTRDVAPEGQEEAAELIIDMLGLRVTPQDVQAGYDWRTPQRPQHTSQCPSGGEWHPCGVRKRGKKKV